ncbi:MAG: hypothetical protein AAGC77_10725 [Pseudomonadota bacterium]
MIIRNCAGVAFLAVLLASCGEAPAKTIEKNCIRLDPMSELNPTVDSEEACACLSEKLEQDMSDENLKTLAKLMKESEDENDFDKRAETSGLSDGAAMTFAGAAKSCAL